MRTHSHLARVGAVAVVSALVLAACSASPNGGASPDPGGSPDGGSTDGGGAAAETYEVESDFGPVELPSDPQAALGMYTTDLDILIHLGIPLAGAQPIRGDGWTDFPVFFPLEELEGIETFANYPEYNYEAILAAEPDLILNGLGYDAEVVARLPEIAPTYSIDAFDGADWRDKFRQVAEALNRSERYQEWIDAYEARVAEVRQRLDEAGLDPLVAPIGYWAGSISVDCYGVPCLVFEDLGLRISPLTEGDGTTLSMEELDRLGDIDVAFRSIVPSPEGEAADAENLATLEQHQAWRNLPFVVNDQYFTFDMEMFYGSPSGHWAFLERVEEVLLGQP